MLRGQQQDPKWLVVLLPLFGLVSPPLLDDDAWRFLWDGWLGSQGINPYQSVPADFFGQAEVPAGMMQVLDRTAYPWAMTIYGPVSQAMFALCAWLSPGQLWVWKAALWLALLVLWQTLRWGRSREEQREASLVLLIPPVFLECGLNAHPDLIAIMLLALALRCHSRLPLLSAVLMALCVCCRVQGYILLPFFLWAWSWRERVLWATCMAAIYAPLVWAGSATEWSGIAAFGAQWEFNSSLCALLGSTAHGRMISLGISALLCGIAFLRWIQRGAVLEHCPGGFCIACVLVGSSVFNPWYALWMLPFIVLQKGSAWRYAWLGLPALSYITQGNLGMELTDAFAHPWWVRPLEFGLLAGASYWASKGSAISQSANTSTSPQADCSTQLT
jgi:alpha-1,6-mannosyltransferase